MVIKCNKNKVNITLIKKKFSEHCKKEYWNKTFSSISNDTNKLSLEKAFLH